MTNFSVIENKITAIEKYLDIVRRYQKYSKIEIENNFDLKGAGERYLYLVSQASVDLAEAVVSFKNHMLQKKDIIFFRESTFKLVKLIFDSPNKSFHIRELAKKTGLSTTAITGRHFLKDLERYGLIKVEKTDLATNIRANLESDAYSFYKKIFNLYLLERYGLIWTLKEVYKPEAIILFGSFAKGEDTENSDIDILIVTQRKAAGIGDFIKQFEKEVNRKVNLHFLESVSSSTAEFKNALANGIVLHGYLKII